MALHQHVLLQDIETKEWTIKGQVVSIRPNGRDTDRERDIPQRYKVCESCLIPCGVSREEAVCEGGSLLRNAQRE